MTKEKAMEVVEDFEMTKAQKAKVKQSEIDKLLKMLKQGKFDETESRIITAGEELREQGKDITPYNVSILVGLVGYKVKQIMYSIGKKVAEER